MIVVPEYHARFGNILFEYVWPRIISTILGYRFVAPALLNLPTDIPGREYDNPIQEVCDFAPFPGIAFPIESIFERKDHRKIVFRGFFQQADKYELYREMIKEWFQTSLTPAGHPPGTLGISIRIAFDYAGLGWDLPLSYYKLAIEKLPEPPPLCLVYADVPANMLDDHMKLLSGCQDVRILSHLDYLSQFQSMMGCQNLIGCNSTFSWWAAFLSNALDVWMPHNYQPWGKARKSDRRWPAGHEYPTDLRCHYDGWHIIDGGEFCALG